MLAFSRRCIAGLTALALGCAAPAPAASPAPSAAGEDTEGLPPGAAGASTEATPEGGSAGPAPAQPSVPDETAAAGAAQAPPDTRSKSEIQRIMLANRDKVRACYDAALAANPGIEGDLVVSFVIDPHGDVKQAEVNWSESDIHVPELDTCAADAVKSLKFPASSRGLESKVNYPFNFHPQRAQPPSKR